MNKPLSKVCLFNSASVGSLKHYSPLTLSLFTFLQCAQYSSFPCHCSKTRLMSPFHIVPGLSLNVQQTAQIFLPHLHHPTLQRTAFHFGCAKTTNIQLFIKEKIKSKTPTMLDKKSWQLGGRCIFPFWFKLCVTQREEKLLL